MKMCSLYSTYPPEHSEHIFNDIISVLNEKTAFEYSMMMVKMMTDSSTLSSEGVFQDAVQALW